MVTNRKKIKFFLNSKTQIAKILKNSYCDKTQTPKYDKTEKLNL